MKKNIKLFITGLTLLLSINYLGAVPADPTPRTITQPDGKTLTIRLRGDEFHHYYATLDGYPLITNNKGYMTYATKATDGTFTSTNVVASEISARSLSELTFLKTLKIETITAGAKIRSKVAASDSTQGRQKAYPLTGTPKSLVILVNFSDKSFVTATPQTAFTNLLNQTGYSTNGGTGSAKDYFRDNSMGNFNPQFDVYGPYTLSNPISYYGANDANGNDTNPQQLVIDACSLAYSNGVNFSTYDTDKDGILDNVFIYYAGYNEAEKGSSTTIWPHRWSLNNYSTKFNGVAVYGYACTSELKGSSGSNMCGIGTFCHEFGHVLGLDDLYNTDNSDAYTVSYWDIMDAGPYLNSGRTPPAYSAYERYIMKWLTPTDLQVGGNYTLDTLTTANKAYLVSNMSNRAQYTANSSTYPEYFILENRQNKGWDKYLPGHGLLATHIYYNANNWYNNSPNNTSSAMDVDIIEADSIGSDGTMSADTYPGTRGFTTLIPQTRSGSALNKKLTQIKETNGIISFIYQDGSNNPTLYNNGALTDFTTDRGTMSANQAISVSGSKLTSNLNIALKKGSQYQIKKSTDTTWGTSISLIPSSGTVAETQVDIRFTPTYICYPKAIYDTLIVSSNGASSSQSYLKGWPLRPVYISAPVATEASDTTIYSFNANWKVVEDSIGNPASGYYLTVFNTSSGSSVIKQGFNNGLTAPEGWIINASAISTSSVYSGDSVPAIQFKNNGEYIQTERYMMPATSLTFYCRSLSGTGSLKLEAWNGQQFVNAGTVDINTSTYTTSSFTFGESLNYTQFRLSFIKTSGYVFIDDMKIGFNQKTEYNFSNKWIDGLSYKNGNMVSVPIDGLVANRDYYYVLKSSDKTLYYENISPFSNTIHVSTLDKLAGDKKLIVFAQSDGTLTILSPEMSNQIYIYNTLGQIQQIVTPTSSKVVVSNLVPNQVYIIKNGALIAKVFVYKK
ncbi:MAG: hypothetical protein RIS29_2547 [Bacteroidota bacterium]|jgi:M6 family metalloprotease-like protein